jgi:hypothetical protein
MRKKTLVFIVMLTFLVFNCKKDEKVTTSKKDLLSGKSWIMTAETISPAINVNGTMITDLYSQTANCTKDDIGKFNSNGTYTLEEGPTKCSVNDPQVFETGTWTLNSDETIIVMTSSTGSVTNGKIQELTASKLVLTEEETYNSIKYTLTISYKPI